jgi:hypothetical protein
VAHEVRHREARRELAFDVKPHGASKRWHLEIHVVSNLETEISSSFVSIALLSGLGYL